MTRPEIIVSSFYTLVYAAAVYFIVPLLPRSLAVFWPLSVGILWVLWGLPSFRKSRQNSSKI